MIDRLPAMPVLKRPAAFLLLIILWAAMYLPGLGSFEIKGEEIRRVMPGVAMLETGDWLVPRFNGIPFLRKPPLINWAMALAIKAGGVRNEWTVRLPSALAMLALALVMVATCSEWLGVNSALAAALIVLTCAGIVEKGRIAEIEAVYIACFGMAFCSWLGGSAAGRPRWQVWLATGFFFGLGMLTKGPPMLAFFYAIAGAVAWMGARKPAAAAWTRSMLHWTHLLGLGVMLAMFAAWWVPFIHSPLTAGALGVMTRQMEQRVGGGDKGTIFVNLLRSLVNLLPWTPGFASFWLPGWVEPLEERERVLVKAARWPVAACAFASMLIPGMLPRYTLPLAAPFAILLLIVLRRRWGTRAESLPVAVACVAAAGWLVYGAFFAQRVAAMGDSRRFGSEVNAVMPRGSTIFVFDPAVQSELFYIHGRLEYIDTVKGLPADVPWILAEADKVKLLRQPYESSKIWATPSEHSGRQFVLMSLHGRTGRPHREILKAPVSESPSK